MKISYFQKNNGEQVKWDNITRDERYFCSELFHNLKSDQTSFLSLVKKGVNEEKDDKERLDFLKNIETEKFDVGFEVCFYRDMLKWNQLEIGKTELPHKRTFDLALFSEDAIIIIEAKAQQGFDTKQLIEFKKDKRRVKKLFDIIKMKVPKIFIVGLHSGRYAPKSKTISYFDSMIKWDDIAEKYTDSKDIFIHANDIYPNKKDSKKSKSF